MSYITSIDPVRLWELVNSGEKIPCFIDYERTIKATYRDIACVKKSEYYVVAGARGICYFDVKHGEREEFIKECARSHVEFIDPASQQRTSKEAAAEEMYDDLYRSDDLLRDALKRINPDSGLGRCIQEQLKRNEQTMKKARGEA